MARTNDDPQKEALYSWQSRFLTEVADEYPHLDILVPFDRAKALIFKIADAYGVARPEVKHHRNKDGQQAYYWSDKYRIVLPANWAVVGWVLVHETAHMLVDMLYGWSKESHGAEFCRLYANLLAQYMLVDAAVVERSMLKAKLKLMNASPLPLGCGTKAA
jgi:hypothetical protein